MADASVAVVDVKPGVATSEYWLTILVVVLSAGQVVLGFFSSNPMVQIASQLVGAILTFLVAKGYGQQRFALKTQTVAANPALSITTSLPPVVPPKA